MKYVYTFELSKGFVQVDVSINGVAIPVYLTASNNFQVKLDVNEQLTVVGTQADGQAFAICKNFVITGEKPKVPGFVTVSVGEAYEWPEQDDEDTDLE